MAGHLEAEDWIKGRGDKKTWKTWETACKATGFPENEFPKHVPKLFKIDISDEEIQQYYDNATKKSTLGKKTTFIAGMPQTRKSLLDDAEGISTEIAISELLDNTLDSYIDYIHHKASINEEFNALRINLSVLNPSSQEECEVIYEHNNGGFNAEQFKAFCSYTHSAKAENNDEKIGVWGKGQKIAMAHIGRANLLTAYVRHYDDPANKSGIYVVPLGMKDEDPDDDGGGNDEERVNDPKNFYHELNTCVSIGTYEEDSGRKLSEDDTQIEFYRITKQAFTSFTHDWKDLRENIEKKYAFKFQIIWEKASKLSGANTQEKRDKLMPTLIMYHDNHKILDSQVLPTTQERVGEYIGDFDSLEDQFIRPPGLEPRRYTIQYGELKIEALVGLIPDDDERFSNNKNQKLIPSGIMMWGNGRLFEHSHTRLQREKHWNNNNSKLKTKWTNDTTHNWWRCYIKFSSSDGKLIPWGVGTKDGYTQSNHPRLQILTDIYFWICWPFWKASSFLKEGGKSQFTYSFVNVFRNDKQKDLVKESRPQDQKSYNELIGKIKSYSTTDVKNRLSNYFNEHSINKSKSISLNLDIDKTQGEIWKELQTLTGSMDIKFVNEDIIKKIQASELSVESSDSDVDYMNAATFAFISYPYAFIEDGLEPEKMEDASDEEE